MQIEVDKWICGEELDLVIGARSRNTKYRLMKLPHDPLPGHVGVGRMGVWSLRAVQAWMKRQQVSAGTWDESAGSLDLSVLWGSPANSPLDRPKPELSRPAEASPVTLAAAYHAGSSLDDLCREFHVGKARLIKLLRDNGVKLRPPGRPRPSAAALSTTLAETPPPRASAASRRAVR